MKFRILRYGEREVRDLNTVVKINYLLEIPLNERFIKGYEEFLSIRNQPGIGLKSYEMELYLKEAVKSQLEEVRKEYPNFAGKFTVDIRQKRITGIFFDKSHVNQETDEKLRRALFDRFSELLGHSDLRVDINLSCNLGN